MPPKMTLIPFCLVPVGNLPASFYLLVSIIEITYEIRGIIEVDGFHIFIR